MSQTRYSGVGNYSSNEKDVKLDGVGTLSPGTYDSVDIAGVFSCGGDLVMQKLDIDGVFNCTGSLTTDTLDCNGVANFEQNVRAKHSDVDGAVNVKGDYEGTTIKCDGAIRAQGTISADLIEADGFLTAREIVGEKVIIRSRRKPFIVIGVTRGVEKWIGQIELIEATTIELQRKVRAKQVNGHDIYIGAGCEIESIDCSGTLTIDKRAKVGSVTGAAAATATATAADAPSAAAANQ